ncbi:MAG: hypothetical protein R3F46_10745 [bacterium]
MQDIPSTLLIRLLLAALLLLPATQPAQAAELLRAVSGPGFNCEAHPWLEAESLAADSQAGFSAAQELGMQLQNLSGVLLHWPKSERSLRVMAGQYGDMLGSGGQRLETSICIGLSDGEMHVINIAGSRIPGFLSKLSAWPTQRGSEARLVMLLSFTDGYEDASVLGFSVGADGVALPLDTSGAHTQWGEFQLADLDDNGSYELLCYRNLDGALGGLSYRSVRGYDYSANSYVPAAESHRRFFELERDWLDWVINTRAQVLSDPQRFTNEAGSGAYYQAEYQGVSYGFDSIVFIDNAGYDREQAREFDNQTRESFRKVKAYRDELDAWLAGGDPPRTWGMR